MWILVKATGSANIQSFDLSKGTTLGIVPVGSDASAITELSTGVVAVGTAAGTAGSVELRNGTSGALSATIPVSGPVKALAPGADGATLYVLTGTVKSEAISVLDTSNQTVTKTIPVSLGTVAVAASPSGSDIYGLGDTGQVSDYPVAGGTAISRFKAGNSGIALAISPDGNTLYVLKGSGAVRNVAEVSTATESVRKVLPAPAGAVSVSVSADGTSLYDVVGTPAYGNIQVFPLT
jgi:DNA-binding beta-propeller fold protein YncE